MCGIVGYVGPRAALPVLLSGLQRLEYRGYDSAGVALRGADGLAVTKRAGRVAALAEAVRDGGAAAATTTIGIGHTRWATHGRPTDANAHPHTDEAGGFALVHNGIIENHAALREELRARGHRFASDTDTEVVVHLLEEAYRGDLAEAARAVARRLQGSFALAIMAREQPDVLVGVRQQTPLVVGLGEDEGYIASDIAALLPYTREVLVLEDGDVAEVRRGGTTVTDFHGRPRERRPFTVPWDSALAERGGYPHFMAKEIHEQPQALRETLRGRIEVPAGSLRGIAHLPELEEGDRGTAAGAVAAPGLPAVATALPRKIWLVACGTAYYACLVGRRLIEEWAGIPCEADIASEFRYRAPLVRPGDWAVAVSQSGETADTLAALREARRLGALPLAVSNVVGASIPREAAATIHTWAGPEIAVCSTKAYTTQLAVLTVLAGWLAQRRLGGGAPGEAGGAAAPRPVDDVALAAVGDVLARALTLPRWAEEALALEGALAGWAARIAQGEHCFFIGRGLDWAVAQEGALKLKEISYVHAEAYAAGELKHGTLALITEGVPVIALFSQPELAGKTASNAAEVRARGGRVLGLATPELVEAVGGACDEILTLPPVPAALAPAIAVIPLQVLAYLTAVARGNDVDKPRNLAKSVTVE
jgi:glucosamine--fructose-6-phosphate aminotransferase (isomerizing)